MKATARHIGHILLAGAVVAGVANSMHPKRIPWVQDWSRQVEALAIEQDIRVIPLTTALERFRFGQSLFIDARSADHFAQGHISGAVSVPFEQSDEFFPFMAAYIDSGRELVVYCSNRDCDDALLLASLLKEIGCSNIVLYIDGFELWEAQGGPIEIEGTSPSLLPDDIGDAAVPAGEGL